MRPLLPLLCVILWCCVGVCRSQANRGIPLGPCETVVATHYVEDYIWDPEAGGTCQMDPIKYAELGALVALEDARYDTPTTTAACGRCFEVYGPAGAQNIIIGDHGSAAGTDFTLMRNGAWRKVMGISSGIGNSQVTVRPISCPDEWIDTGSGNLRVRWQPSGANDWYFELHVDNHRVGVQSLEVQGANVPGGSDWVTLTRKPVSNWFVYEGFMEPVGFPLRIRVTSEENEQLEHELTGYQSVASAAYNSKGKARTIDFGANFGYPADPGAQDCRPPRQPSTIYADSLFSVTVEAGYGWRDWGSYQLSSLAYDHSANCHSGTHCIAVQYQAWGAIQIGTPTRFVPQDYDTLVFWARANVGGGESFDNLRVFWTGQGEAATGFAVTNEWQEFQVDLADLDLPDTINVVQFGSSSNSPQIFLDDISLTGGDGQAHYYANAEFFTGSDVENGAATLRCGLCDVLRAAVNVAR